VCIVAIVGREVLGWCVFSSPRRRQATGRPRSLGSVSQAIPLGFRPYHFRSSRAVPVDERSVSDEPGHGMPRPPGEVLTQVFNIIPERATSEESNVGEEQRRSSNRRCTRKSSMRWALRGSTRGPIDPRRKSMRSMRGVESEKTRDQCCSAGLVRNVLEEVALARRHDDATHSRVRLPQTARRDASGGVRKPKRSRQRIAYLGWPTKPSDWKSRTAIR